MINWDFFKLNEEQIAHDLKRYFHIFKDFLSAYTPESLYAHHKIVKSVANILEKNTGEMEEGSKKKLIVNYNLKKINDSLEQMIEKFDYKTAAQLIKIEEISPNNDLEFLDNIENVIKTENKDFVLRYADLLTYFIEQDKLSQYFALQEIGILADHESEFLEQIEFFEKYKDHDKLNIICDNLLHAPQTSLDFTFSYYNILEKYIEEDDLEEISNCIGNLIKPELNYDLLNYVLDIFRDYQEDGVKAFTQTMTDLIESNMSYLIEDYAGCIIGGLKELSNLDAYESAIKSVDPQETIESILLDNAKSLMKIVESTKHLKMVNSTPNSVKSCINSIANNTGDNQFTKNIIKFYEGFNDENNANFAIKSLSKIAKNSLHVPLKSYGFFKKHLYNDCLNNYAECIAAVSEGVQKEKVTNKVVKFIDQNIDHEDMLELTLAIKQRNGYEYPEKDTLQMLQLFEKYIDNHCSEISYVLREMGPNVKCEPLFSKKAYNEIKRSVNPKSAIRKIIHTDYFRADKEIEKLKIHKRCSQYDIDLVRQTSDFVMNVHENRNETESDKILDGFYLELKRAVNQGIGWKNQIDNLRLYCKDVAQGVKNNAKDLMVVHNA